MADLSKWIQWRAVVSEPQTVGERTIRLQAQALSVTIPYIGFVWNRPTAVLVEKDGLTDELPIIDVTRYALIGIGVMGAAGMILAKLLSSVSRD